MIAFIQAAAAVFSMQALIQLVIVLVIVGVLLWVVEKYLPIDATIKRIIHIVVILVLIIWLLRVFGLF